MNQIKKTIILLLLCVVMFIVGACGKTSGEMEFRVYNGVIQCRVSETDEWSDIISLDELEERNILQGLSAYQIAVENGFSGSEEEWLATLNGSDGRDGLDGENGTNGENGKSAYEIAVKNGFSGSEEEWLLSLKGETVNNYEYKSLYDDAVERGAFSGTFEEFVTEYVNAELISQTVNAVMYASNKSLLSVVSIVSTFGSTTTSYSDGLTNETGTENMSTSSGAGVIYSLDKASGDAIIVTNFHVIYKADYSAGYASKIKVYLYGMEFSDYAIEASLIGGTATYDLAVLKISGSDILKTSSVSAVQLGNSDDITVGETVIAIGNAEAEGLGATSGIVSVDSQTISITSSYDDSTSIKFREIRVDAAVNPGNSGGGLFDTSGKLIGIVNAKKVDSKVDNMGYALPSSLVWSCVKNILANCDGVSQLKMSKCLLGATITVDSINVYYDELTFKTMIEQTVIVDSVSDGSAAFGILSAGDVINSVSFDGVTKNVSRVFHVTDFVLQCSQNDVISLNILRDGVLSDVEVQLVNKTFID